MTARLELPRAGLRALLASAALGLLSGSARADDPRADSRAAFLRGVSEAHQEHFTAARDAFLEAYRLFPHPSILLNLGIARMRTGEYIASEENLTRFLADAGGSPAEEVASARAALESVRIHLGTLRIRVNPIPAQARTWLDGLPLELTPSTFMDVRAVVGPAELRIDADGYLPVVRQILVEHDQVARVDVLLVARGGGGSGRDVNAGDGRPTVLGWGLVAGGSALAVLGTIAGVEAITHAHDYNTPGSSLYQDRSTRQAGVAWRTSADVLFATALVSGGVGAYFLLWPRKKPGDVRIVFGPASAKAELSF